MINAWEFWVIRSSRTQNRDGAEWCSDQRWWLCLSEAFGAMLLLLCSNQERSNWNLPRLFSDEWPRKRSQEKSRMIEPNVSMRRWLARMNLRSARHSQYVFKLTVSNDNILLILWPTGYLFAPPMLFVSLFKKKSCNAIYLTLLIPILMDYSTSSTVPLLLLCDKHQKDDSIQFLCKGKVPHYNNDLKRYTTDGILVPIDWLLLGGREHSNRPIGWSILGRKEISSPLPRFNEIRERWWQLLVFLKIIVTWNVTVCFFTWTREIRRCH